MACSKRGKVFWRSDIIRMYKKKPPKNLPKWLVPFMTTRGVLEPECGSYKAVYVIGDLAISVEETDEDSDDVRNQIIRERLGWIEEKYQQYFNYSKNEWVWQGFRFRELSLCPKGTLADMMRSHDYTLEDVHLKQLIRALQVLHRDASLVIGDLKPANIMFCKCDCLAFIDLDSAVILPIHKRSRIYRTGWWNIIRQINPKTVDHPRRLLIASDWIAISLVVMMHYAVKEDDTQLSRRVIRSYNDEGDFNYEYIKDIKEDEIYEYGALAEAAYDIIRHFRLLETYHKTFLPDRYRFTLPDRKYIDKLLDVSWSHRVMRYMGLVSFQNALKF